MIYKMGCKNSDTLNARDTGAKAVIELIRSSGSRQRLEGLACTFTPESTSQFQEFGPLVQ